MEFRKHLNTYPDFFSSNLWHFTIQIPGSSHVGAIYIPKYYALYRFIHPGSWSHANKIHTESRIKDFKPFIKRSRELRRILPSRYGIHFNYVSLRRIANFSLKERISYRKKVKIIKYYSTEL